MSENARGANNKETNLSLDTCRDDYSFGPEPACVGEMLSEHAIMFTTLSYASKWIHLMFASPSNSC